MTISIALVGDFDPQRVIAHKAIPLALELGNSILGSKITWKWVATQEIQKHSLNEFHGIWVVPGSPYQNMEGVLDVIRYARENHKPFLGTCGGFQHALIEYARNVCGISTANHAETHAKGEALIVSPLSCSLIGEKGGITFTPGSALFSILGHTSELEEYHCNYGLNPDWRAQLEESGLEFTGFDSAGEVRAFELPTHPFYIGTLFQPERVALQGKPHPLVTTFMNATLSEKAL